MVRKVILVIALLVILLCANDVAYANETKLQSDIYKIGDYNGKRYIQGIPPETRVKEVIDNIKCDKQLMCYDENDNLVSSDNNAKSGMYLQIDNEKYYIIVGIDINKDGNMTTTDILKICLHVVETENLEDIGFLAADINVDGAVTGTDVLRSKNTIIDIIEKENLYFEKEENSEFEYNLNLATKNIEITKIKNTQEELVIPELIEGKKVYSLSNTVFEKNSSITEIEIPKYISKITTGTFSNCTSLETITVNEGNEIYEAQDGILFTKGKTELICYPPYKYSSSYEVPKSVTTIKTDAFLNTMYLEELHIGDNVKTIEKNAISNWKGTIYASEDSAGIKYAKENNIKFELPEEPEDGIEVENTGVFVIPPVDPKRTQIKGRYNPENNVGIDIGGDQGEKVVAVMSGYVGKVDEKKGSVVIISKNRLVQVFFVHMDNIQVQEGTNVKQGDKIGEIGRHGLASEAYSRVDYGLSVLVDGKYEYRNPTQYTGH